MPIQSPTDPKLLATALMLPGLVCYSGGFEEASPQTILTGSIALGLLGFFGASVYPEQTKAACKGLAIIAAGNLARTSCPKGTGPIAAATAAAISGVAFHYYFKPQPVTTHHNLPPPAIPKHPSISFNVARPGSLGEQGVLGQLLQGHLQIPRTQLVVDTYFSIHYDTLSGRYNLDISRATASNDLRPYVVVELTIPQEDRPFPELYYFVVNNPNPNSPQDPIELYPARTVSLQPRGPRSGEATERRTIEAYTRTIPGPPARTT